MPKIIVDGKEMECREGVPVLQAAIEAGLDVPHYCYHPGLSIVASCRLCLMEMKMPHPQTKEMVWTNKLLPSCQTMVKEGMEVRFNSDFVKQNQKHTMEYYLLNHPLDCPVCDKAGECYLQDYSERFGNATSRMVEEKTKNPKKDIGPHTLLYQDRCVLCTRCVRFCDEVAGDAELAVVERGSRGEIDVFPGAPLDNKLQGNVVDLCPVGCLLSKDFLFQQRVWFLEEGNSVCAGCSRGCTVKVDRNDTTIYRLRPRFNEKVNEWWICDEGRFGWKYVHSPNRLSQPRVRRGSEWENARWEAVPAILGARFEKAAAPDNGAKVAAVISPFLSNEEAWLLVRYIRRVAPGASLVLGFVPVVGQDEKFPKGFVIKAEKCPNRAGVERILKQAGGTVIGFDEFLARAGAGEFHAAYVTGGYPSGEWANEKVAGALGKIATVVVHDLFGSKLDAIAAVQLPSASWLEREGTFMNCDGIVQPFARCIPPLEGVKPDGQLFHELVGEPGLYRPGKTREKMAAEMSEFAAVHIPRVEPEYAH